eukprot:gene4178-20364_t
MEVKDITHVNDLMYGRAALATEMQNHPVAKLAIRNKSRVFKEECYNTKDWLCGSKGENSLFCWPCLLFRPRQSTTWTMTGYNNMQDFLSDCQKHEKAKYRIRTFDLSDRDVGFSRARREEVERHNKEVDETTDISTKEQLSAIVRLDRNGEVVERFFKFFNIGSDRSASALTAVVKNILGKYGESLKGKLIMQTYDGAYVMSGNISGVQQLLRQDYPFVYFFHCAANRLNLTRLSEVYKLFLINTSVAVSSASVERSFSCLGRVKT